MNLITSWHGNGDVDVGKDSILKGGRLTLMGKFVVARACGDGGASSGEQVEINTARPAGLSKLYFSVVL